MGKILYVRYFLVKSFTHNLCFIILYQNEHAHFDGTLKMLISPITRRNFDTASRFINFDSHRGLWRCANQNWYALKVGRVVNKNKILSQQNIEPLQLRFWHQHFPTIHGSFSKDMHRTKEEGRVHGKGNVIKKNLNSFFSSTITFKWREFLVFIFGEFNRIN